MIHDPDAQHKPHFPPLVPLDAELAFPDNDPSPARCPTCGRPRFSLKASAMLDMVLLAQDVLSDLKAAMEDEVVE